MEEFIEKLMSKAGLDRATAEKVFHVVKEHIEDVPKWVGHSGVLDKLPGGIGGKIEGLF
jgi:hypothetical protein